MKNINLTISLCLFAGLAFGQSKTKTTDTAKNAAVSKTAFKMHYDDLFRHNADGTISPKQILQINGEMVNTDTKIAVGTKYGGVDLSAYTGHDMLVDTLRGVVIIRQVVK
jgi:hypothetical protein